MAPSPREIRQTVEACGGNRSEAAERMGIARSTVTERLGVAGQKFSGRKLSDAEMLATLRLLDSHDGNMMAAAREAGVAYYTFRSRVNSARQRVGVVMKPTDLQVAKSLFGEDEIAWANKHSSRMVARLAAHDFNGARELIDAAEADWEAREMEILDPLRQPLAETGLCVRTLNFLEEVGIITVEGLLNRTKLDLMRIPNFGPEAWREVVGAVEKLGFEFADGQ